MKNDKTTLLPHKHIHGSMCLYTNPVLKSIADYEQNILGYFQAITPANDFILSYDLKYKQYWINRLKCILQQNVYFRIIPDYDFNKLHKNFTGIVLRKHQSKILKIIIFVNDKIYFQTLWYTHENDPIWTTASIDLQEITR